MQLHVLYLEMILKKENLDSYKVGMTMKIMMWTMPVMIGFFAFMNVAAFALYLVVSYVVTLIVSLIMMFIYHVMDKKMDDDEFVHTYGRPNFNK